MSTKVKGDKIKEGSIPLSALDNFLYNLSNSEDKEKCIAELKKRKNRFCY